jgi:hypothetical protein
LDNTDAVVNLSGKRFASTVSIYQTDSREKGLCHHLISLIAAHPPRPPVMTPCLQRTVSQRQTVHAAPIHHRSPARVRSFGSVAIGFT